MSYLRLGAFVIAAACATEEIPPTIGPTIGSTHVVRVESIRPIAPRETGSAPMSLAPTESRRLLAATNQLEVSRARPDRAHVVHALRALVDVLEVIAPDAATSIDRARDAVDRLDKASAKTPTANLVRVALDAAQKALGDVSPVPADPQRYREAMDDLRIATVKIDPELPLLEQYAGVRAAFRASVRVVFAATNCAEPSFENARNTARK
jgi:hypothetical protein